MIKRNIFFRTALLVYAWLQLFLPVCMCLISDR